jgi:hypothetical protein
MKICLILANRAIFNRIFHANRKGRQFGVCRECLIYQEVERSPIQAYFPSGKVEMIKWEIVASWKNDWKKG